MTNCNLCFSIYIYNYARLMPAPPTTRSLLTTARATSTTRGHLYIIILEIKCVSGGVAGIYASSSAVHQPKYLLNS